MIRFVAVLVLAALSWCAHAQAPVRIVVPLTAGGSPDTLVRLLAPDNVFSVNPHLGKAGSDPLADLAPVTLVARVQFVPVVPENLPVRSPVELIALARARPGELNYGSSGIGSPQHLGAPLPERIGVTPGYEAK